MKQSMENGEKRWVRVARTHDHKPDPTQKIPELLWDLGTVFFPMPRGKKGWNYPHHLEEFRYEYDSEILNAYFEAGWGYGISCSGDLVVLDIDEPEYMSEILSDLPESAHQISGSGRGVHIFYIVEDLNTKRSLYKEEDGERVSIGDLKCDPNGYVVGPGSIHPSGTAYGPLAGNEIVEVDKDELIDSLEEYFVDTTEVSPHTEYDPEEVKANQHDFYSITAEDVAPSMPRGERTENPFHGSGTGTNFMKNDDGETFTCWRCQYGGGQGCGLNGLQYLAASYLDSEGAITNYHCEHVRSEWKRDKTLHYYAWLEAADKGLVNPDNPPYSVLVGHGLDEGLIESESDMSVQNYHTIRNSLIYSYYWL